MVATAFTLAVCMGCADAEGANLRALQHSKATSSTFTWPLTRTCQCRAAGAITTWEFPLANLQKMFQRHPEVEKQFMPALKARYKGLVENIPSWWVLP